MSSNLGLADPVLIQKYFEGRLVPEKHTKRLSTLGRIKRLQAPGSDRVGSWFKPDALVRYFVNKLSTRQYDRLSPCHSCTLKTSRRFWKNERKGLTQTATWAGAILVQCSQLSN